MESTEEEATTEEGAAEERAIETPTSEEDAEAPAMRKHNGSAKVTPANGSESSPERRPESPSEGTLRALKMHAATYSPEATLALGTHLPLKAQR